MVDCACRLTPSGDVGGRCCRGPVLSVGVGSVGGVIGIETELLAPGDFLGNATFARTLIGHYQAIELEQLAAYAATVTDEVEQGFMPLEVSTLLHISDRAAERRIRFAAQLVSRLPQTLATLKQGRIEEFKAQLIAEAVEPLSDDHALAVEARVLDRAPAHTPTQVRNALAKAVLVVDPRGAEERRQERVRGRRVESRPTEDGMAMLTVHHTAERIAQAHSVIIARARELKALGGEQRTLAQLEADVAADLLLGVEGGGRVVEVHLTVPASTLCGQDDQPGEVDGVPVTARAARELAAEASSWRWVRTDPDTGLLIDLTYSQYQPPKVLADFVKSGTARVAIPAAPAGPAAAMWIIECRGHSAPPATTIARACAAPITGPSTRAAGNSNKPNPAGSSGPARLASPTSSHPIESPNPNHPHRHEPRRSRNRIRHRSNQSDQLSQPAPGMILLKAC
jgi:uncharacterized protein DUF222